MLRAARTRFAVVVLAAAALSAATGAAPQPSSAAELDLDRLYSLPRIIGTAPSGFAWSADSRKLAFLWNDEGTEFRDVWVVDAAGGAPQRVTRFPRPELVAAGTDVDALRANQRAEQDRGVAAATWFPDGSALLVSFRGDLFRAAPGREPEALGIGGRQAQFSTDGQRLAFIQRGDVWIAEIEGAGVGEARRLTSLAAGGVGVARYSWSPDGSRMAVIVRDSSGVSERLIPDYLLDETDVSRVRRALPGEEPGRTRLLVVDTADGTSRQLLADDDDRDLIFSFAWSPDGSRLLVDKSDLYVKDRRVLALDAASGAATVLHREQNQHNVMAFWSAAWTPDGVGAYVVSDRDGYYHLYRVEAGQQPRALTRGEWEIERFHVTDEALFLVTNQQHPSERHIYRLPHQGGEPERLSSRPGTHSPTYSPDGSRAAVLFSSDSTPPDLFLNPLDGSGEVRVTDSPLDEFAEHDWITPEYVTFPSHVDGATIHGRLMLPPDFDPARTWPAIIGSIYSNTLRNQWGGRNAHPLWGLDQYLLQQGYVLLNINIRGSWGLGRDFRTPMQRDYGGIDTEDIYSGVLWLESRGDIDMDRVGIWGSSYGGLMTAMSLFKRPGVFAAGVAGAPATNVWHATTGEMRVMGRPQDEPEAYAASSAFTHAAGLADPLMIIHGMRDRIVLFKDSLVLVEHLMLLGKADLVELVALPNSPHGWDAGALYQTRFAFEKLVEHFDRHLKGDRK